MSDDFRDLANRRAYVRIYDGAGQKSVMAEGQVIGYQDNPTLLIRHADGSQSSWSVALPREELSARREFDCGVCGAKVESIPPFGLAECPNLWTDGRHWEPPRHT